MSRLTVWGTRWGYHPEDWRFVIHRREQFWDEVWHWWQIGPVSLTFWRYS